MGVHNNRAVPVVPVQVIQVGAHHKAYDGLGAGKEIGASPNRMCIEGGLGVIVLVICPVEYTVLEKVPVQDQVVQSFAVGVVVIAEYVQVFIAVVQGSPPFALG